MSPKNLFRAILSNSDNLDYAQLAIYDLALRPFEIFLPMRVLLKSLWFVANDVHRQKAPIRAGLWVTAPLTAAILTSEE